MYKLLLCWRYLRTRYIALVSIISVTLGVATMIVVNSVMEGFTSEMQNRIHGIISDVVVESRNFTGHARRRLANRADSQGGGRRHRGHDADRRGAGACSAFNTGGQTMTRPVQLIGIDENTQSLVSDFSKYLQHPENRKKMSFDLRDGGYDTRDHQGGDDAPERPQMADAGWKYRQSTRRAAEIPGAIQPLADGDGSAILRQQSISKDPHRPRRIGHRAGRRSPNRRTLPPPATNGPTDPIFDQHPEVIRPETPRLRHGQAAEHRRGAGHRRWPACAC